MRFVRLGLCLWITAAGMAWPAEAPVPAGTPIGLRDDQGERIASPLEICFRTDLRGDCVSLGGDGRRGPG